MRTLKLKNFMGDTPFENLQEKQYVQRSPLKGPLGGPEPFQAWNQSSPSLLSSMQTFAQTADSHTDSFTPSIDNESHKNGVFNILHRASTCKEKQHIDEFLHTNNFAQKTDSIGVWNARAPNLRYQMDCEEEMEASSMASLDMPSWSKRYGRTKYYDEKFSKNPECKYDTHQKYKKENHKSVLSLQNEETDLRDTEDWKRVSSRSQTQHDKSDIGARIEKLRQSLVNANSIQIKTSAFNEKSDLASFESRSRYSAQNKFEDDQDNYSTSRHVASQNNSNYSLRNGERSGVKELKAEFRKKSFVRTSYESKWENEDEPEASLCSIDSLKTNFESNLRDNNYRNGSVSNYVQSRCPKDDYDAYNSILPKEAVSDVVCQIFNDDADSTVVRPQSDIADYVYQKNRLQGTYCNSALAQKHLAYQSTPRVMQRRHRSLGHCLRNESGKSAFVGAMPRRADVSRLKSTRLNSDANDSQVSSNANFRRRSEYAKDRSSSVCSHISTQSAENNGSTFSHNSLESARSFVTGKTMQYNSQKERTYGDVFPQHFRPQEIYQRCKASTPITKRNLQLIYNQKNYEDDMSSKSGTNVMRYYSPLSKKNLKERYDVSTTLKDEKSRYQTVSDVENLMTIPYNQKAESTKSEFKKQFNRQRSPSANKKYNVSKNNYVSNNDLHYEQYNAVHKSVDMEFSHPQFSDIEVNSRPGDSEDEEIYINHSQHYGHQIPVKQHMANIQNLEDSVLNEQPLILRLCDPLANFFLKCFWGDLSQDVRHVICQAAVWTLLGVLVLSLLLAVIGIFGAYVL